MFADLITNPVFILISYPRVKRALKLNKEYDSTWDKGNWTFSTATRYFARLSDQGLRRCLIFSRWKPIALALILVSGRRKDPKQSAFSYFFWPSWQVSPRPLCYGEARLLIVSGLSIRWRHYKQLALLGAKIGILFLLLGAALITAGIGWFRRRLWGWRLAVVIIATQVLGDVLNCFRSDWLRGGTGVIIAGALLLLLLQPRVRAMFT